MLPISTKVPSREHVDTFLDDFARAHQFEDKVGAATGREVHYAINSVSRRRQIVDVDCRTGTKRNRQSKPRPLAVDADHLEPPLVRGRA